MVKDYRRQIASNSCFQLNMIMCLCSVVTEDEKFDRQGSNKSRKLREKALSVSDGYQLVWPMAMQQILSMKRDILESRESQSFFVRPYRRFDIIFVIMHHHGNQIQSFREILVSRFVDMQV